jgi:hypothetical protein
VRHQLVVLQRKLTSLVAEHPELHVYWVMATMLLEKKHMNVLLVGGGRGGCRGKDPVFISRVPKVEPAND